MGEGWTRRDVRQEPLRRLRAGGTRPGSCLCRAAHRRRRGPLQGQGQGLAGKKPGPFSGSRGCESGGPLAWLYSSSSLPVGSAGAARTSRATWTLRGPGKSAGPPLASPDVRRACELGPDQWPWVGCFWAQPDASPNPSCEGFVAQAKGGWEGPMGEARGFGNPWGANWGRAPSGAGCSGGMMARLRREASEPPSPPQGPIGFRGPPGIPGAPGKVVRVCLGVEGGPYRPRLWSLLLSDAFPSPSAPWAVLTLPGAEPSHGHTGGGGGSHGQVPVTTPGGRVGQRSGLSWWEVCVLFLSRQDVRCDVRPSGLCDPRQRPHSTR